MGGVDCNSEKPPDSSSATEAETDSLAVTKLADSEKKCHKSLLDEVNVPNSDFLHSKEKIEEGDTVIIYVNFGSTYAVKVRRGQTLTMRYGALRHEFLIGKPYGSRVSATAGYIYALRGSPELWTRTLPHRTQILYTP
uniref:tRNA (adenine(58)-N(1))-methyltransferase n=1 Tax=Plectus sambesii TaxID=2011161 RepID=A0A914XLL6_9BILA